MKLPSVRLHSEAFSAMGNVVAEGVCNQLGRPKLDRLTLLVRESVQNSWDARTGDSIRYALESSSLDAGQRAAYADYFREQPPRPAYVAKRGEPISSIDEWLRGSAPRLLVVSDRGTTGLDGPTRADAPSSGSRNFVDFLRNIGQPPGRGHTGGTFGYGKAALYLSSEARTIVVYTRVEERGRLESRLTAAALTHNFEAGGRRYTGRHWWGRVQAGGLVEPHVGSEADDLARALGIAPFAGQERGTSIAITAPVFDDGELRRLGRTCLRHLWPKLRTPTGRRPPISLTVRVAGLPVTIPDPARTPPYDAFWRAYARLDGGQAVTYQRDEVGRLALERTIVLGASDSDTPDHERAPQHVALLRTPELVVKYLDVGRGLGVEHVGFAGVFRTREDFDEVFARSEPPTHDDWQAASVADKRARGIVNTALKKIRDAAREFARLESPTTKGVQGAPLARLANEFGMLVSGSLIGAPVTAPRGPTGPNKPKRTREVRPRLVLDEQGDTLVELNGVAHAVFAFDVTHAAGSDGTIVVADVFPLSSGGAREQEPPRGRPPVKVGWWESPRGARVDDVELCVGPRQQGTWKLFVAVQDDVGVGVELTARPEHEP